jgi:hypothetical protein
MLRPAIVAALLLPTASVAADKPAVVELLEDDPAGLIAQLTMGGISGHEEVKAAADTDDVFSGKAALRVSPAQRFNPEIKGWDFSIAEKPRDGEYRYLRFAWKKVAAGPIMLQFCTRKPVRDWTMRYYMGEAAPPWESKVLAAAAPVEWQVVTRDLFRDFGAVTIGGIAFTPLRDGDGLFDHILLGRTVEDLDRATSAAMLKTIPKPQLSASRLNQLWADLASSDEFTGTTAVWLMIAGRKQVIPYLRNSVSFPAQKGPRVAVPEEKVKPLIEDLKHYRYVIREAAAADLYKLGDGVLPHLRVAAAAADGEAKVRLAAVLDGWKSRAGLDELRLRRCVTVLRTVDTAEARELLARIENARP